MARPITSANTRTSRHRRGRIFVRCGRYGIAMPPRDGRKSEIRVQTGFPEKRDGKVIRENLRVVDELLGMANMLYDDVKLLGEVPYPELLEPFGYRRPEPPKSVTAHEVWDVFVADTKKARGFADGADKQYELAKARYLPHDVPLPSNDAEAIVLARQLLLRRNELGLAPITLKQSESRLKAFFDYCVKWKHAGHTPFLYIDDIEADAKKVNPFSLEELIALDEYLCRAAGGDAVFAAARESGRITDAVAISRMAVRLTFGTGARIMEAVAVRRQWLVEDGVHLQKVKGGDKIKNPSPPRTVYYAAIPGLSAIVSDCIALTANMPDGLLLPVRLRIARGVMDAAAAHFGWPVGKRWHAIRKTAVNYWRDVLGIPQEVREKMAGQTEDVAEKHYLEEQSVATLHALQGRHLEKIERNRKLAGKLLCSVFD